MRSIDVSVGRAVRSETSPGTVGRMDKLKNQVGLLINEHTIFSCRNSYYIGEGSCASIIDSSYLECVVCERSEFSSRKGPTHSVTRDLSPTLFLEYHCVASDYPITLNALYSAPGHHDASGGDGGSHSTWSSSGGYMEDKYEHCCILNEEVSIPALGVVNILLDTTSILLPDTLNVVLTVTV